MGSLGQAFTKPKSGVGGTLLKDGVSDEVNQVVTGIGLGILDRVLAWTRTLS
jgi:hypothetical protein